MRSNSTATGLQARIDAGNAALLTRSGLDWTIEIRQGASPRRSRRCRSARALIDGELVVENESGASDFSALQADLSEGRHDRFVFYAFDLLYLDGYDLRATPLLERKQALASLLGGEAGDLALQRAFRRGRQPRSCSMPAGSASRASSRNCRDAPYRSGRGKDWLKAKCSSRQEFVIGGYVPSTTSRKAIGSLVLGYYSGGKLVHAGRVGTGFTRAVAEDLYRRLERIRIRVEPFRRAAERRCGAPGALCEAGARRRDRVPRLDRGSSLAPRRLSRLARGQAGKRGRGGNGHA